MNRVELSTLPLGPVADSQVRPRPALAPRLGIDYGKIRAQVEAAMRHRGLRRSLEVASVLVQHAYGGDPSGFRGRSSKAISLRRLVASGMPLSAAALYRSLAVYEIWVRTGGHRLTGLTASHYRAVEALATDAQGSWLSLASERRWSAARLRAAIVAGAPRASGRGGRLPVHPVARFVARVARELTQLDQATERICVAAPKRKRLATLACDLDELGGRCRAHAKRIRAALAQPGDRDTVVAV